jgi:hypothetical protein
VPDRVRDVNQRHGLLLVESSMAFEMRIRNADACRGGLPTAEGQEARGDGVWHFGAVLR